MSDKQPLIINPENFDPITKEQEGLCKDGNGVYGNLEHCCFNGNV